MNAVPGPAVRRWLPVWLPTLLACGLLLVVTGCKKDEPAPPQARQKAEPVIKDGLSEDWRLDHPECSEARKIEKPAPDSPEALLRQVFAAASGPDDAAGFQRFYETLDAEQYTEEWARSQFWGRIREHVAKYVESPQDPTYIVCREDRRSDEQIKLYVFSKEKQKTHTPYGFRKRDGQWRIEFFTP
jgi:hypothetical protein